MEENPLANGRDGFLSLVQGCKLRLEAVFSERHVGTTEALGAGYAVRTAHKNSQVQRFVSLKKQTQCSDVVFVEWLG